MKRETLSQKRSRAAKLGGLATLERYGVEHYRKAGQLGGRPRMLTLAEMRARGLVEKDERRERLEQRNSFISKLVIGLIKEANAK